MRPLFVDNSYAKSLFIVLFKKFVVTKIFQFTCAQPSIVIYNKKLRFLEKCCYF